jgi:hypothetical protein
MILEKIIDYVLVWRAEGSPLSTGMREAAIFS